MKILLMSVPPSAQRYDTVGDWVTSEDGDLKIIVSSLGHADSEFLVALHELVEAYLCQKRGISAEEVDKFDLASSADEPGDDPLAPYYQEHQFAMLIERLVAHELGVDWNEHEKRLSEVN